MAFNQRPLAKRRIGGLDKRYLAQRRMRGLSDWIFGLGDLVNIATNAGIRDVGSLTGLYDPNKAFQFPMPSQAAADLATEVSGAHIVPPKLVSKDVQQTGANQQALAGMIPVGVPVKSAMFLGLGAKLADKAALQTAKEMLKKGMSRDEIWRETGWFNQHGDWKFEIPDEATHFGLGELTRQAPGEFSGTMDEVFEHPQLFENYPQLAKRQVVINTRDDAGGYYPGGSIEIGVPSSDEFLETALNEGYGAPAINAASPDDVGGLARSTALHELQHGVQTAEGFPLGGWNRGEDYRGLAGEVEARNVQRRINMTAEERRARPPWETQDAPDDQQIVRRSSHTETPMSSVIDPTNPKPTAGLGVKSSVKVSRGTEVPAASVVDPTLNPPKGIAAQQAKATAKAERIKGLGAPAVWKKHPISQIKTTVPVESMHAEYEPFGKMQPEKPLSWEALEGHNVIPLLGDPTIAGQRLLGLGGQRFKQGVDLYGGPGFPRFGGNWANTAGAASTMGETAAELTRATDAPTSGVYMKMSGHSGDYAAHMAQVVNEQFKLARPAISKDAIKAFDDAMRADWLKKKKGGFEYPATKDWPGMENLTDEWIVSHPNDRKKMVKMMNQRPWQDAGFPDVGYARWATTEPDLLNAPSYTSGHSAIQFDPQGKVIRDPEFQHPTYPSQPAGTYSGRLPDVPVEVLHKEYLQTGYKGGPIPNQYLYKFLQTRPPVIIKLGAERLDRVMNYLRSKEGGTLGLGGAVAAGLLSQSEADEINREAAG